MQAGFWDMLRDLLLWLPRKVWELLLDGLATVIEAIPVPSFVQTAESVFAAIPPGVAYFAQPLQLEFGVGVVLGAYVLRFVIRRIPVIG